MTNNHVVSPSTSVHDKSNNDLAHTKVDPYQDSDYKPQLQPQGHNSPTEPVAPVGQNDSLTDQTRRAIGQSDTITPEPYKPLHSASMEEDTSLDDTWSEAYEPHTHALSQRDAWDQLDE
ncbi:MAG: hypothetical protein EOP04_33295 [Proteobacteria bacterium]|nr:MAG: hypothetical protein EOP04_33295 [Pseudomonadota bacterium]